MSKASEAMLPRRTSRSRLLSPSQLLRLVVTTPCEGTILLITTTVSPDLVPSFLEHLRPLLRAVVVEPECYHFEVALNPLQPGVIKIIEGWRKELQWIQEVRRRGAK